MAVRFPHIAFSLTVRDLGLTLDQQLTFAPHINRLCRDCYYQLRQLLTISRSLTFTATATFVHAFVTSQLNYCSTLYVGLPAVHLGCLEQVIRTAVRLIEGIPRTGHVTAYRTCLMYSTGSPPAADHIPYWCPGLEVYPGSCSSLPPRSLLSNPGHQRSQFTPLIGTGVTLCSFCSSLHNPGPCILGGR